MIRAYVGLQGSGKTFSMVNDACNVIDRGLRCVSNVPIKTAKGEAILKEGKAFWDDFMVSENTLYVLDEGGILLGKYEWKNVSLELWWKILLHRKYGNHIFFGTPDYKDVSTQMRNYVYEAVDCRPVRFPFFAFRNIYYRPKYFEYNKEDLPLEAEKDFIIRRKLITSMRAKKVFTYYDTKYTVVPSINSSVELIQPSAETNEDVIGMYL